MQEKAGVPVIRFAGFTCDWEQHTFLDIAARVSTMSGAPDLPRVEYEDINSGQGTLNKDLREKVSTKFGIRFQPGDVLYGKLRPYLKNWLFADFSGIAVGDFWVLRGNDTDGLFLYSLIQNDRFDDVANQSTGTKMPRADWPLVSKTEFFVPPQVSEQRQIGTFLLNLDHLITLHQNKYSQLCNVKKSMLERMFPKEGADVPEIRFAGFTEAWENREVGELIEDYIEKTTIQNQYPVLTSSQQQGIVFQEDYFADRQVTTNDNIGYYVLPFGYFTYRSRSDTDIFVFNRNNLIDKGIISYYYPVFKPENADSDFLLRRLNYGIRKQLSMAAEGSGQRVLSHNKFKKMIVSIPTLDEQTQIGEFFETLDTLITCHQRKLGRLQNMKKACLEKMFI